MQPKERPKQPALSSNELKFFEQLEEKCRCKLERHYYNHTSKGLDTLFAEKYDKVPFIYSLSIDLPKEFSNDLDQDSLYNISKYLKENILNNNKMLKKIIIYKNYDSYQFENKDNQLIENK